MNQLPWIAVFLTKRPGFASLPTRILLVALVVTVPALLFALEKIEPSVFANVFFAIASFAGGLCHFPP